MARFIDLDTVLPEDITVRLGGADYHLPGDIPVPDFLAISRAHARLGAAEDADDAIGATEALYERILQLFQVRQPDLPRIPLGVQQAVALVFELYRVDEPEVAPDPPEPTEGGTTSTKRPAKRTTRKKSGS